MTDPWGEQSAEPTATEPTSTAVEVMDEPELSCPHCGTPLVPHHDAIGSLHCYDPQCSGCCFLPPDGTSNGQPRQKMEARPCRMAQRVASAF